MHGNLVVCTHTHTQISTRVTNYVSSLYAHHVRIAVLMPISAADLAVAERAASLDYSADCSEQVGGGANESSVHGY